MTTTGAGTTGIANLPARTVPVAAGQLTSLSARADRLAAVVRLMGDCVDRLGNGTAQSQDDLADLLYLIEIETRQLATGLGRIVDETSATAAQ